MSDPIVKCSSGEMPLQKIRDFRRLLVPYCSWLPPPRRQIQLH
jgi:hypothetical protein